MNPSFTEEDFDRTFKETRRYFEETSYGYFIVDQERGFLSNPPMLFNNSNDCFVKIESTGVVDRVAVLDHAVSDTHAVYTTRTFDEPAPAFEWMRSILRDFVE